MSFSCAHCEATRAWQRTPALRNRVGSGHGSSRLLCRALSSSSSSEVASLMALLTSVLATLFAISPKNWSNVAATGCTDG
eukprot:CAMPEP_0176296908 /NCGR_PEP_ID=MMETSP0121_2-20121125/58444_1 /TAXON_ID=160619 /ORGANISM="Kryptoperidinium foliaceum, Strain CCMP 1326" /LENGTH=79 /DNA_ID=CAMNT_0017638071 /DNA_START=163 /DNA_END=399 /DNA_ORIENTATION=+